MDERPLFSIITVTYNAEPYLEPTILSIIQQEKINFEYIIVDGKSKDGTLDIINKYLDHIDLWLSEADQGIYDAMNKGLKLARGKYVWFINAGDKIYHSAITAELEKKVKDVDILFGETMMINEQQKELGLRSQVTPLKLPRQLNWKSLNRGMVVCHQSFIIKKAKAAQYDLKYLYSADIDWVIKGLKSSEQILNTETVLAAYLQGGFSKKNLVRSLRDRFAILQSHYGLLPNLFNHLYIIYRALRFRFLSS